MAYDFDSAVSGWRDNEASLGHDPEGDRERQREDAAFLRDCYCDCSHDQTEHRVKRPTTERTTCMSPGCECQHFVQMNLFDTPKPCAAVELVESAGDLDLDLDGEEVA